MVLQHLDSRFCQQHVHAGLDTRHRYLKVGVVRREDGHCAALGQGFEGLEIRLGVNSIIGGEAAHRHVEAGGGVTLRDGALHVRSDGGHLAAVDACNSYVAH